MGETIVIEGEVMKTGRKLGFTEVRVRREDEQKTLLATGRHTKAFA